VPPATVRIVEADGRTRDRRYWRPVFERGAHAGRTPEDWRAEVEAALRQAVRRRLVADIPVGVLLSGGVDSSLIVALLAEEGVDNLATFSIGFDASGGQAGDEFEWSDRVVEQFGTDHHRIHVPSVNLPESVDKTIGVMTEPMASHDVLAFYLLSEQVAKDIKVVQSGQGADEVFAGYEYYQSLVEVPRSAAVSTFQRTFADVTHAEIADVLSPEYLLRDDVSTGLLDEICGRPGADTALDAVLRAELTHLMPDDPVKRVDNMTMAWGVEARVPFLDHELVEVAAACPPELKLAQGGKGVLKDIARPLLPAGLVDRPKGYFPVPAVRRLGGELLSVVTDVLRSPAAKQRGLVDSAHLDTLLADEHARIGNGGRDRLWQLAVLEMWLQKQGID
jgi:asparagine synthase (glutamine-hydrolysing)